MARPAHLLLNFAGTLSGGNDSGLDGDEEFSVSVRGAFPSTYDNPTDLTTMASGAKDAWATNINPLLGPRTILRVVTAAAVGSDGLWQRETDGSYTKGEWTGTSAGTANWLSEMPRATAVCATLLTARAGATGKGRIFLPTTILTLTESGRLQSTSAVTFANGVKGFINALNALAGVDVGVVSSKGYISPVTAVKVGRTPDTLRSRRRSQGEVYQQVSL